MMFLERFQMPLDDDSRFFFPLLSKIVLISQAHFGQNVWTCIQIKNSSEDKITQLLEELCQVGRSSKRSLKKNN